MKKVTLLLLFVFQLGFAQSPVQFFQSAPVSGFQFGYSLAVNNDEVLASSYSWTLFGPQSIGKTFLFTVANGALTQSDSFLPAETLIDDNFGSDLAIKDNTIAIGASGRDDNFSNSGAVYVYHKVAGIYQFAQKITASDGAANAYFGSSVKISNNQMFIKAVNTATVNDECFIYIYNYNGTDWVFNQKLAAIGGNKMEVEGNLLVTSDSDLTSVSFYRPNGSGNWEFSSTLQLGGPYVVDFSLSGNNIYAIRTDGTTTVNEYRETINGVWGLYNSFGIDVYAGDQVFTKIEVAGDKLFLGSTWYILQMTRKFPVLYFKKTDDVWSFQNAFYGAGPNSQDDFFGSVMASQGNSLVIGAPNEEMTVLNGRAYYLDLALLATQSFGKKSALVYPNPTQDKIYIQKNSQASIKKVSIVSVTGNLLFETTSIDEVSLQKLADGIYFARLTFDNSSEETFKIIKN